MYLFIYLFHYVLVPLIEWLGVVEKTKKMLQCGLHYRCYPDYCGCSAAWCWSWTVLAAVLHMVWMAGIGFLA